MYVNLSEYVNNICFLVHVKDDENVEDDPVVHLEIGCSGDSNTFFDLIQWRDHWEEYGQACDLPVSKLRHCQSVQDEHLVAKETNPTANYDQLEYLESIWGHSNHFT